MTEVLEPAAPAGIPLEQAVEEFIEFTFSKQTEISYEARQQIRMEKLKAMIAALAARKRGES